MIQHESIFLLLVFDTTDATSIHATKTFRVRSLTTRLAFYPKEGFIPNSLTYLPILTYLSAQLGFKTLEVEKDKSALEKHPTIFNLLICRPWFTLSLSNIFTEMNYQRYPTKHVKCRHVFIFTKIIIRKTCLAMEVYWVRVNMWYCTCKHIVQVESNLSNPIVHIGLQLSTRNLYPEVLCTFTCTGRIVYSARAIC